MINAIKCQSLFSFNSAYFKNLFSEYEYPWQILPDLKRILIRIINQGIEGYELISDGILVGKDVSIDKSAHIDGPTIIGHGCAVRHGAYIRGSVILGDGCVVGNSSEIKNSILMDRAQAPHFNYVGDSILGEGAHLGAGAICSNLRSDKGLVKIKVADGYIDTGLKKLGAILGDYTEIGCGAVLCPSTIIGKSSTVYPLTMTRGIYPSGCIVKQDNTVIYKK